MSELIVELRNCEATLLAEIADPAMKQKDVASTYGLAILSSERNRVDWAKVNQAIMARWSRSGLERIKAQAWKLAEGKR
jgi:hypothetical protein